jgi:hypothetical protein
MHEYHEAAHFEAELCRESDKFAVRITAADTDSGSPDYTAGYVPIHLEGPYESIEAAQCALETFLIGIYHRDVSKKHTYRCAWCSDSAPIPNMTRVP